MKLRHIIGIGSATVILSTAFTVMAQDAAPAAAPDASAAGVVVEKKAAAKPQATCPITGNKIDKSCYVDTEGCRIYVCCKDCIDKVKADPKACMKKIAAAGEQCQCVCGKCGCAMNIDPASAAKTIQCPKCKTDQPVPAACCGASAACPMKQAAGEAPAAAPAAPEAPAQ